MSAQQKLRWQPWAIGLALVVLALAARTLDIHHVLVSLGDKQPLGGFLFSGLYATACVLFLPGFILTLASGALFGVVMGTLWVSLGSTVGASLAFLIGRYLARDWIAAKLDRYTTFRVLDKAVGEEGWKIVGLTRLSPIFPFNLLNYAFGLTRVSFRDYVIASWIGMLPGTVLYVYVGSLAGELTRLSTSGRARTPAEWVLYAVGLLATVAVTILVTRKAKTALKNKHIA